MKLSSFRAVLLAFICLFSLNVLAGVDINSASAEQLAESLSGVGPAKAQAIVAYRDMNGPFQSVEQLTEVKGIGPATVDKNRDILEIKSPEPKTVSK